MNGIGWNRKSSLRSGETASFCYSFYSKMEDMGWFQDFIFLFLILIKGMRRQGDFKVPVRGPRGGSYRHI